MNAFTVRILDEQAALDLPQERLVDCATHVLISEGVAGAELNLLFVEHEQMQALNRRHLNHDYSTDVLSFLLESSETDRGTLIEGELVVCTEMAIDQARRFGWQPLDEVLLYIVHGTLHLLGYDDQSPPDLAIMRRRETEMLAHWDLTPRYSESDSDSIEESDDPDEPGSAGGRPSNRREEPS